MTDNSKNRLDAAIQAMRNHEPSSGQTSDAAAHAWERIAGGVDTAQPEKILGCEGVRALFTPFRLNQLTGERRLIVSDHLRECGDCSRLYQAGDAQAWRLAPTAHKPMFDMRRLAFAAMLLVIVGLGAFGAYSFLYAPLPGTRAQVQSVKGPVYLIASNGQHALAPGNELNEGDVVRTSAGGHAFLKMFDGSVVELNERAELSITARRKATTIHLSRGHIIVQAAKQHGGHLYVATRMSKVSVVGTDFSVDSGLKGDRVSVVEGEVHVDDAGSGTAVLNSGDQYVSSNTVETVSVAEDFSWSANREQHLALLAEFSKLQRKLEGIPEPPLRYDSALLRTVPANAVVFASIPNYGESIAEADRLFNQQLSESEVLRDWWQQHGMGKNQAKFDQTIARIRAFSQYLGNEVVFALVPKGTDGMALLVVAKQEREGLADYIKGEIANSELNQAQRDHLKVLSLEEAAQGSLNTGDFAIVAGPQYVAVSSDAQLLRDFAASRLQDEDTGFAQSGLGEKVAASYTEGAGIFVAADLESTLAIARQHHGESDANAQKSQAALDQSGFGDVKYLVFKRREQNGVTDNRAILSFRQQRHGVASWLASPSTIGSLQYVSQDAIVVSAAVVKQPAQMVDDVLSIITSGGGDAAAKMAEFRSKANFDLRDQLAAALGGDFAVALDGPILPTPAWKLIAEVNDPQQLQSTLQVIVDDANREALAHGQKGVSLSQTELDGRVLYAIKSGDPLHPEVHYTFDRGYIVAAPSDALVMKAIHVRDGGETIVQSPKFTQLLPRDENTNVSAFLFQDLAPMANSLAGQLNPNETQSLQTIAANARPSLLCFYGEEDRIEAATLGKFLGLDVNNFAMSRLLGATAGTSGATNP